MTEFEEFIATYNFGPLLTINQAAKILNRSPNGFRAALCKKDDEAEKLNKIKVKYGRRTYFPTDKFFNTIFQQNSK